MASQTDVMRSSTDSTFPVLLPEDPALCLSFREFEKFVETLLRPTSDDGVTCNAKALEDMDLKDTNDESTVLSKNTTKSIDKIVLTELEADDARKELSSDHIERFNDALRMTDASQNRAKTSPMPENKIYTENTGIAYRSTDSPLLDLFTELEKTVSGSRLKELLESAWAEDPLATLKIVWNCRSIHIGKADKLTFYRCLGWMKDTHPKTILSCLSWTFRSTIEKKAQKEDEDTLVIVQDIEESEESDETEYNVQYGVSHGYWKDLLNILVLAVNEHFDVLEDPRLVLNKKNDQQTKRKGDVLEKGKPKRRGQPQHLEKATESSDQKTEKKPREQRLKENVEFLAQHRQEAKNKKHQEETVRYTKALRMLEDPFYHALHLTVARLFAEQLRKDMDLLKVGKGKELDDISLAAKWAPSLEGFHDKQTFIASTIAELLYPQTAIGVVGDTREIYLRQARESYRRFTLSPLRKRLEIVESDVSSGNFKNINYAKVPSLAMDNYKEFFARKDFDRFEKYIDKVAQGRCRISGAVLMPASLVHQAYSSASMSWSPSGKKPGKELLQTKMAEIANKTLDGQWRSLVQRIKDNGTISSSIAVCDVSGSMAGPIFSDKTCPMDTAIGLSLLLAEITEPPFGGSLISFSAEPAFLSVGGVKDTRSFVEKVQYIKTSNWDMNTDFVAVFERLILPAAITHNLKAEDMVKQVFVFSDMQFDSCQGSSRSSSEKWDTAFDRITKKYAEAGYEMPKLIFWNLASGRNGGSPKPVTKETNGTILVGGYSQGMMKMFLENGGFDVDVDIEEEEEEEEDMVVVKNKSKKEVDPMKGVWKAIGHKAYDMFRVVD